jgi:hypothetical protein
VRRAEHPLQRGLAPRNGLLFGIVVCVCHG